MHRQGPPKRSSPFPYEVDEELPQRRPRAASGRGIQAARRPAYEEEPGVVATNRFSAPPTRARVQKKVSKPTTAPKKPKEDNITMVVNRVFNVVFKAAGIVCLLAGIFVLGIQLREYGLRHLAYVAATCTTYQNSGYLPANPPSSYPQY